MSKNRDIVEAALAGQPHGSVARQYGISTVWVGKRVARWRAGGWDAVEKKNRPPGINHVVRQGLTMSCDNTQWVAEGSNPEPNGSARVWSSVQTGVRAAGR